MQVTYWAGVRCILSSIVIISATDCQKGGERKNLLARLSSGGSQEPLYTALAVWHGAGKGPSFESCILLFYLLLARSVSSE